MTPILVDHNIEGQVGVLTSIWESSEWFELWQFLCVGAQSLADLGLADNIPDSELWQLCQDRGMILITGNRNADGEDSLELTMRRLGRLDSLPVLTISNPDRVISDRDYANAVAVKVLEILLDLERLRGTRRLFIP
jgi:hypothetical protein